MPVSDQKSSPCSRNGRVRSACTQLGVLEFSVIVSNEDPDSCMAYVCFDTTENYQRNSDRPAQDAWYQQLRALIQEWFNGTIAMVAVSVD
jgi:hypothetical protein